MYDLRPSQESATLQCSLLLQRCTARPRPRWTSPPQSAWCVMRKGLAYVAGVLTIRPMFQGVTNPYGQTKYMMECVLRDHQKANPDWGVVLLRYFNPVGAHPSGKIGEDPQGRPNNLMPYVQQVAVGRRPHLTVHGGDYDTVDGTGVRDYIHVVDLAAGHLKALEWLDRSGGTGCEVFNLGTGKGISVMQMVEAMRKASGAEIKVEVGPRRPGDLASVYAKPDKVRLFFLSCARPPVVFDSVFSITGPRCAWLDREVRR